MKGNLTSILNSEVVLPYLSAKRAPLKGQAYSVKYTSCIRVAFAVSVITSLKLLLSGIPLFSPPPPSKYGIPPKKNFCLLGPKLLPINPLSATV